MFRRRCFLSSEFSEEDIHRDTTTYSGRQIEKNGFWEEDMIRKYRRRCQSRVLDPPPSYKLTNNKCKVLNKTKLLANNNFILTFPKYMYFDFDSIFCRNGKKSLFDTLKFVTFPIYEFNKFHQIVRSIVLIMDLKVLPRLSRQIQVYCCQSLFTTLSMYRKNSQA